MTTYLDHAATTPMRPEAVEAMLPFLTERFGNPSGSHAVARETRKSSSDPNEILHSMGLAYCDLLADRDMLRLQMQAYAACDDPAIQHVVREEWTSLYDSVKRASGADPDAIHQWFAEGMLMNVSAAVGGLNPEIEAKLARGAFDHD